MKQIKRLGLGLIAGASIVLASAASGEVLYLQPDGTGSPSKDGSIKMDLGHSKRAKSLYQVKSISVQHGICAAHIGSELRDNGFRVTDSHTADAKLRVSVSHNGNLRDPDSVEDGTYTATLDGNRGKTLFSARGSEGARNLASLCGDIGEDIADRLKDRMG
jgi:hypothetical protein